MSHALLLLSFLIFAILYTVEAASLSTKAENLLLILPAGGISAGLILWILFSRFLLPLSHTYLAVLSKDSQGALSEDSENNDINRRGLLQLSLFAAYAVLLPIAGFDVTTVFFIFASLWVLGERSLAKLTLFSIVFGLGITLLLDFALPVDVPLSWEIMFS